MIDADRVAYEVTPPSDLDSSGHTRTYEIALTNTGTVTWRGPDRTRFRACGFSKRWAR